MATSDYAELEISLDGRGNHVFAVDLVFRDPNNAVPESIPHEALATFDPAEFAALRESREFETYGKRLSECLLDDKDVSSLFDHARRADAPLRVVLHARPSALEVHDLCWEALCEPNSGAPLLASDRFLFSRFLPSVDRRPVQLRSRKDVRARVIAANPRPSRKYPLARLPKDEPERTVKALGGIRVDVPAGPATLDTIIDGLRDDPVDVLLLICHGSRGPGDSILYLETDDGAVDPIPGREFAERLGGLVRPPNLVALTACESAASGSRRSAGSTVAEPGAVAAVGPLLLERSGVAAVVAMQDTVSQDTATSFIETLFRELCDHGQIDLAAARARDAVRERHDWWIPVLFSRLHAGQIWYTPGFSDEKDETRLWNSIMGNLEEKCVTAILGPELLDSVVGSTSDLAMNVLSEFMLPEQNGARDKPRSKSAPPAGGQPMLSEKYRDDLVQVSQFLAVIEDEAAARLLVRNEIERELYERFGADLPRSNKTRPLGDLISAAGKLSRSRDSADPFVSLAQLPICYYVSATPDNLLEDALSAEKRPPATQVFNWRDQQPADASETAAKHEDWLPYNERDAEHPFLLYLLGSLKFPETVVLTEDNYLDFLIAVAGNRAWTQLGTDQNVAIDRSNRNVIHHALLRALSVDSLMFVGFSLEDWSFRVVFRSIVHLQQSEYRKGRNRACVAVQLAPDESRIRDPKLAREYLEGYFRNAGIGADVKIYWGTAQEFLRDLSEHLEESH